MKTNKKKQIVVVHQSYQTDVNLEHVIRGNSAVLKCSVPSFVADFVTVDTWLVDDNHVVHGDSFGKEITPLSDEVGDPPSLSPSPIQITTKKKTSSMNINRRRIGNRRTIHQGIGGLLLLLLFVFFWGFFLLVTVILLVDLCRVIINVTFPSLSPV